jgi:hypothetical protein
VKETDSKGDAWIPKCSQPLLTQKKSMKTEPVPLGKSSKKPFPKVTSGFFSAPSPVDLETVYKN